MGKTPQKTWRVASRDEVRRRGSLVRTMMMMRERGFRVSDQAGGLRSRRGRGEARHCTRKKRDAEDQGGARRGARMLLMTRGGGSRARRAVAGQEEGCV